MRKTLALITSLSVLSCLLVAAPVSAQISAQISAQNEPTKSYDRMLPVDTEVVTKTQRKN